MKKHTSKGFTLIELLMVIAIIGILAGILIPTVGAVRKQANIAASKAQLSSYVSAIEMFKGDYGYYPTFGVTGGGDTIEVSLNSKTAIFMETLSGRDAAGEKSSAGGNRRQVSYHSFSDSEFFLDDDDTVDDTKLADRFNNQNIVIVIDNAGNGVLNPTPTSRELTVPAQGIRASVSAYVDTDPNDGDNPVYSLWN
jgi:prepilin-type N-terminal cleavage/methylation domain-containing protein